MSAGWQAYRWLVRRWALRKRKAQGVAGRLNPAAQDFGLEVLALWNDLRETVHKPAKALPPCPCDPRGRSACGGVPIPRLLVGLIDFRA